MAFHKNAVLDSVHALTARAYANVAARDADAAFQATANLNKMVRVDSPLAYYMLVSLSPTVWADLSDAGVIVVGTIYAQLSSSVDQNPADTNPTVITYNTQDAINGLTHSTTVNPGEVTIVTDGIYFVSPQPQVGKTGGGSAQADFDMFLQVDRGSGFADEPNSNVKLSIKDTELTDVIVSAFSVQLNAGDKIRVMQRVSDSAVGMGLKNTDPVVGPPTIPRTPSVIFTMYRIGGIA